MKVLVNDYAGDLFQLQLSEELARRGHSVSHCYFSQNTTCKIRTDSSASRPEGVSIHPLDTGIGFSKYSIINRQASDKLYGQEVGRLIQSLRPDIVISANTPLDGQRVIINASREAGAVFLYWLQDILSSAMEFALKKKKIPLPLRGIVGHVYRKLEIRLLKDSDRILCIAPEFRDALMEWGIDDARISIIENWSSIDNIVPAVKPTNWQREHGLGDRFLFMYSGTLGMKHVPELLYQLARKIEAEDLPATVVVIGEGAGVDWMRAKIAEKRLDSLVMLPYQPAERLSEVLASSDVLVSLLDTECATLAIPSKTLTYLCAQRPILLASPAQNLAARIVRSIGAGVVVESNVSAFISAACDMMNNYERYRPCGEKARKYAEEKFNIRHIGDMFEHSIEQAITQASGRIQNGSGF